MVSSINMLFLLGLLSFPSQASISIDKAADELCLCLEGPYQQAEKTLSQLKGNGGQDLTDLDKVTRSQDEMMEILNASNLCLESLRHLYPDIAQDIALQDKTLKLIDSKCPDPLSMNKDQPGQSINEQIDEQAQ